MIHPDIFTVMPDACLVEEFDPDGSAHIRHLSGGCVQNFHPAVNLLAGQIKAAVGLKPDRFTDASGC
jgi:hypothetical protein